MDTVSEQSFENALDKIRELSKQNATLLETLETTRAFFADTTNTGEIHKEGMLEYLDEAISKAKEK